MCICFMYVKIIVSDCLIYLVYLFRMILINYIGYPRQYITTLFRMILISVYMPAYLDLLYITLLVYFGTVLIYLDLFYITSLSYFGTILFNYMFVNIKTYII